MKKVRKKPSKKIRSFGIVSEKGPTKLKPMPRAMEDGKYTNAPIAANGIAAPHFIRR